MDTLIHLVQNSPSLNMHFDAQKMQNFCDHVRDLSPEKQKQLRDVLTHEQETYPQLKKQLVEAQTQYLQTIAKVTTQYKFDIIHRAEEKSKKQDRAVLVTLEKKLESILSP